MNQGLRRGWRANRAIYFFVLLFVCIGLFALSQAGVLAPVEGILSTPLNALSGVFQRIAISVSGGVTDLTEVQSLQQRNAELEQALSRLQAEVVDLREVSSDYQRLAALVDYSSARENEQMLAADVIGYEQTPLRTITINRGTRDGLRVGMPVVTDQGLVGRIIEVQANGARVLLVSDPSSAISARLQTTRAEGTVQGLVSGNLEMTYIPLGAQIQDGDLVLTSGMGGNLPPDLVLGQVTSSRAGLDVYQVAQVRSLIDFDALEMVLVVTNFQPVDLSAFPQNGEN
jgi:rod shape-determining protein MreC